MHRQNFWQASKLTVSSVSSLIYLLIGHNSIEMALALYYCIVTSAAALPPDETLLAAIEKGDKEEVDKIDQRLAETEKTEGESEISDALKAHDNHLTQIGDSVRPSPFHCQLTPHAFGIRSWKLNHWR
jgi:hypothetical protein